MCPTFMDAESYQTDEGVLPPGLVVVCMDDSEVARRLLVHTLSKQLPQSRVTAFGEEEEDVERFMCAAIAGAHVVILDQHLTFGQTTILGTAVIERLLACSYRGFIAIRSADSSPEDEMKYLESGVHLMLSKDLRPVELVTLLAKGYFRFLHRESPPSRTTSDLFPPDSKTATLMSPCSHSTSTLCTSGPNGSTMLGYTNPLIISASCSYSSTCTSHRTTPVVPHDSMPLPGSINAVCISLPLRAAYPLTLVAPYRAPLDLCTPANVHGRIQRRFVLPAPLARPSHLFQPAALPAAAQSRLFCPLQAKVRLVPFSFLYPAYPTDLPHARSTCSKPIAVNVAVRHMSSFSPITLLQVAACMYTLFQ
eukprot:GGOE01048267.1.p1 GENE.GGOE01048267.1~~GGOE01048267.1.p1  ORF type:complete len:365 (+),score=61.00 GGOE01048267.1:247-1341(+)